MASLWCLDSLKAFKFEILLYFHWRASERQQFCQKSGEDKEKIGKATALGTLTLMAG